MGARASIKNLAVLWDEAPPFQSFSTQTGRSNEVWLSPIEFEPLERKREEKRRRPGRMCLGAESAILRKALCCPTLI